MATSTDPILWESTLTGFIFLVTSAFYALAYRDPKRNCVTRYLDRYHRSWVSLGGADGKPGLLVHAIVFAGVGIAFLLHGVAGDH